jgi:hypothetical protein
VLILQHRKGNAMPDNRPQERKKNAIGRVLAAVDDVVRAAEELKRANVALSLEAKRPPLKLAREARNDD